MDNFVEQISDDLSKSGWSYLDGVFDISLLDLLREECVNLASQNKMKKSKIGKKKSKKLLENIRGDYIHWIDNLDPSQAQSLYLTKLLDLSSLISQRTMMSLNALESHYSFYPPGSQYQKHLDVFKKDDARCISTVLYLNSEWQKGDGGELCIYCESDPTVVETLIDPLYGRLVIFLSRNIFHQVMPTNKPRYSMTGWLKSVQVQNDPLSLLL